MVAEKELSRPERAQGMATVLAIGTANPQNCIEQSTYPDFYFKITNRQHMVELKNKFKRICDKSSIKKRYVYLTEDILKQNPSFGEPRASSFDARQEILVSEVPKLGQEASKKAIAEWGQPKSSITHLIFGTSCGIDMPGADYELTRLLGLSPSVKRLMFYHQGCFAGGTVLRVAKDIAENNKGSRVFVVCVEITSIYFIGPNEDYMDGGLVSMALFGDGAAANVVGSDPIPGVETPLFELFSTAQTIVPDSHGAMKGHIRESGLVLHLHKDIPSLISNNIDTCLEDAFKPLGISDWNSIFWVVHPGGIAILDQLEQKLSLQPERLSHTRNVLREYGNMSSVSVFFILDEIRKSSVEKGLKTTGDGLQWGVLFGLGPGITVETVVLRSVDI